MSRGSAFRLLLVVALALGLAARAPVGGLRVVTTIPDLADLVRRIGGERVQVRTIARGLENIHTVQARPSDIVAVSKAQLFVEMGLSLEHAYVPNLLMTARNQDIRPGRPGFVNCSDGWEPIGVPAVVCRGQATDLHPMGNPHFNLHPDGGEQMARRILEGLVRTDPGGREAYEARFREWQGELARAKERWERLAESFRGKPIVSYHPDFDYFALAYDMPIVATVESRPGVPPTARDLTHVIATMREHDVHVILTPKWSNNRDVAFVAEKSGARVLEVPIMVGGATGADSWIAMMDVLHERLAEALGGP